MYSKILYAFLCICLGMQVFCGDEHDHDHDHDHHHEDPPLPQVPVIFHNPGVHPAVTTQNPYIFVPHDGNGNYHTPNVVKFQQRNPGDPQRNSNFNGEFGNNDRYPNSGNYDHQKDPQIYNKKDQPSQPTYQLSAAYPEGCDSPGRDSRYCTMTIKITPNKNKLNYYNFELRGKSNGYVAVGLSEDLFMGEDHIVECIKKSDGTFEHYQSFSKGQETPQRIVDDASIVNNFHYGYKDGYISCSFDRFWNTYIQHHDKKFIYNLREGNHHILLAIGGLKDPVKGDVIGYHGKHQRYVTPKYIYEMKKSPYYRNGSTSISLSAPILLTVSIIYTLYAYIIS